MVGLLILLAIGAAVAAAGTSVFVVACVNAVAAVWANGVLANFRGDPQNAPSWAAMVSAVTGLASIGLLVAGLVLR